MLARVAHALSVSLWFGAAVFFTAAGLLIFPAFERASRENPKWLPRAELYAGKSPDGFPDPLWKEQGSRAAGVAVGSLFTFYFALQAGCAAVALLTSLRIEGRARRALCAVGLAVVLLGWGVERYVEALRVPRNHLTDEALEYPTEANLAAARAARAAFGMWHGVSLLVNFAALGVSGALAAMLGGLPGVTRPGVGVVAALAALALTGPASAYAPVPFPRPGALAGRWTVTFTNGVVEACEVRRDGTAHVAEPNRAAPGRAVGRGAAVLIAFDDDRVERWTLTRDGAAVEHWFPASAYPHGASVRGVARRSP